MINLKCPKCGSVESFNCHQVCYVSAVVDDQNMLVDKLCLPANRNIFDSDIPYGPYTCRKCEEIFDEEKIR